MKNIRKFLGFANYYRCYDLAKWLSYYLYFFSSLWTWTYYTRMSIGKCHMTNITHYSHKLGYHKVISHNDHGKVVHRPYNSCISNVQKLMRTPSSSFCQLRLGVCSDLA